MRANYENPWRYRNAFEGRLVQSFVVTNKLSYESHVWINDWPPFLHVVKALLVIHLLAEDQVG